MLIVLLATLIASLVQWMRRLRRILAARDRSGLFSVPVIEIAEEE